jgi:hypothetical protein
LTAYRTDEPPAWLGAHTGRLRILAEIWATVDLERSVARLRTASVGANADPGSTASLRAANDPLLGARVLVLTTGDGRQVAVAEPSTEGRLAGTLARLGEGHVGAYLETPVDLEVVGARAAAAHIPLSRPAFGPFGRSVLVLPGKLTSQLLILVERPAVPSPA